MVLRLVMCTMSEKRRALLDEDPDMAADILGTRESIPGLANLDKAWDALRVLVSNGKSEDLLERLLSGDLGEPIGPPLARGPARMVGPDFVIKLAPRIDAIDPETLHPLAKQRLPLAVHAGLLSRSDTFEEDMTHVSRALSRLKAVVGAAKADHHGLLVGLV